MCHLLFKHVNRTHIKFVFMADFLVRDTATDLGSWRL